MKIIREIRKLLMSIKMRKVYNFKHIIKNSKYHVYIIKKIKGKRRVGRKKCFASKTLRSRRDVKNQKSCLDCKR